MITLLSGSHFGAYDILFPIGAGGMGQVFAARDTRLGRKVALKILPPESTARPNRVRRFELEARAASALNHPNILTVFEIGEHGGIHFMATEFVEGQTLRSVLKSDLPLTRTLEIGVQIAAALAAAHSAGIVHRDIKPENIMVRTDGYVKVLDFGLAKLTESGTETAELSSEDPTMTGALTQPGQVIGTWRYMSPEQARGLEVDARSDIWSFGTVLYEMVTGTAPFAAPTATDTLARILEREPPPVTEVSSSAPPELHRIISRALAKERTQRYQNVKDLELDLRELARKWESQRGGYDTASPAKRSSGKSSFNLKIAAVAVIVLAVVIATIWWMRHSVNAVVPAPPVPTHELTYRLHAQRLRDGKPLGEEFLATGQQVFDSNWRIRLDFTSPEAGSLYVLDQGQTPAVEFSLFFPLPGTNNGVAQVAAGERVTTDWARFQGKAGREQFWIVWSTRPQPDLEDTVRAVSNPQQMGIIRDPVRIAAITGLLAKYPPSAVQVLLDQDLKQTTVRGHSPVLINDLALEHH
jgi:serine/threonine protein kinase